MKLFATLMTLIVLLVFSGGLSAAELGFNGIGGSLDIVSSNYPDEAVIFGVHADLGDIIENLVLFPNIDYYSVNNVSVLSLNANARYYFPTSGTMKFFAGGGLGFARFSVDETTVNGPFGPITVGGGSDTEIQLNLLGGLDYQLNESLIGTAQLLYATKADQIKIIAGVTYLLGN